MGNTRYAKLVEAQREFFLSGGTADLAWRRELIEKFKKMLLKHKQDIDDAIFKDLHRDSSDVDQIMPELDELLEHLEEWNAPKHLPPPVGHEGITEEDRVMLVHEPLGVVLVIGPWNYPLVTITPLVHALAAGNTVIVKPSEQVPTFCSLFARLIKENFDERVLAVVEGGVDEARELLEERFDHILYTGNPKVAKDIMAAAARHLTPVTLELGGKNPIVVDDTADVLLVARGVREAKMANAGQICICTDYLITTPDMKPKLVEAIAQAFDELGDMSKMQSFARIVNERHFKRLTDLLKRTEGRVLYKAEGEINEKELFIPFHLIECRLDDPFMEGEIFGPLLPILTVENFDRAIQFVKRHEKPLAAYLYSNSDKHALRFIKETSSGGVTVNDTMKHANLPGVPFGGVGNSGMGRINGKYGFDCFSHEKPVCMRIGRAGALCH